MFVDKVKSVYLLLVWEQHVYSLSTSHINIYSQHNCDNDTMFLLDIPLGLLVYG